MRVEDKIFLEENEIKPNRYVANVMLYVLIASLLLDVLNELHVFHVNAMPMRVCCLVIIASSLLIQPLGRKRSISQASITKFYILALVLIATFAFAIALSQWAELLIAFPITLAMQYHSKKVTWFATINTLVIALLSAPISVLLSLPQVDYYEFLIKTLGYSIDGLTLIPGFSTWDYIGKVFLYISIPRFIIVITLALIAAYITKLVSTNIRDRAEVTILSTTDVLTGLFNRLSYESKLEELEQDAPAQLACIFADADGLHELNNRFGHNAGDRFLKTCADQLSTAFGPYTYRIGGDEFVSFAESADERSTNEAIESICREMAERGYHVSIGAGYLREAGSVKEMIAVAEENMYEAKRTYYSNSSFDRRKHRS